MAIKQGGMAGMGGGPRGPRPTGGGSKTSYVKVTVKSVAKYPKAASTQKKLDKSLTKLGSASTQKQKQVATKKAVVARSKAHTAASKFNKVNNQRLEMKATRKSTTGKIKSIKRGMK